MGDDADPESEGEGTELDTVFRLLANQRRRFILHELQKRDGFTSISTLAEQLADRESSDSDHSIRISLLHQHLPLLAEARAITFDSNTHAVALTEKGEHINECRLACTDALRQLCC